MWIWLASCPLQKWNHQSCRTYRNKCVKLLKNKIKFGNVFHRALPEYPPITWTLSKNLRDACFMNVRLYTTNFSQRTLSITIAIAYLKSLKLCVLTIAIKGLVLPNKMSIKYDVWLLTTCIKFHEKCLFRLHS